MSEKALSSAHNQRDAERLQALYAVSDMLKQVVAEGLDIDVILPRVLHVALEELNAYSGSIVVVDEHFELQHAWLIEGDELEEDASPFLREVVERGLFSWVMHNQQTGVVNDTRNDERWLPRPNHATEREPWSAICSPLIVRSRPVGAITMTKPGKEQFDQRAIHLLEAIANQAASTIESARLYQESRRRASELAALVSATAAVSTSLDLEEVLQDVARQMVNLVDAAASIIFDWDETGRRLAQRTVHGAAAVTETIVSRLPQDLAQYPLIRKALHGYFPVHVRQSDPTLTTQERRLLVETHANGLLLLPLVAHEQTIGLAILVDTRKEHEFSQQEINFVQMLANQAAVAIQNARLYQDAQRQLKVSALLNEASKVINSSLDTNEILQSLLAQMNELLNAEAISIALVDKQRNELVYEVAEGLGSDKIVGLRLPSNQGISGWVMEHGEPALVPNTENDPRFNKMGDERTGYDTQAMICAPLQVKDEVLGTVQAINPRQSTFSEDDLQLLVNLANLASSALANAQQFARTQAAEARYLSLFDESVNPILLTNPAGTVVEANRRACEFLGYRHEELLGLPIASLHRENVGEEALPSFDEIGHDHAKTFTSEVGTRERPNTPVEVHVKRTLSGDSELLQWIYRDISQEVELEEMREDLMAMLVHDLQSPLGNVISSLELLRYELPPNSDPVLTSIVDIAARSSNRLQTLIRSLLDITRLEAGHPIREAKFVKLSTLIEDAQELIVPTIERRQAKLVVDVPEDLPRVYVEEDMIRRVFVNLLDNASKYTPERKAVTVRVRPSDANGSIHASVSDEGPGIPQRYREIIFDKFRRLQEKGGPKGIGLGLAFCRLAVEAHGGRIWIDDAPTGGARFNFTLPTEPFATSEPADEAGQQEEEE
ncbi:MAG: GAF domain-containing protein [Candidatus Promineifilaceae bacterium]|nr:GAF domain-containing protein [Candidatus Promineifilaceae bacterium]